MESAAGCGNRAAALGAASALQEDWYLMVQQQGEAWGFSDEKLSALLKLAKAMHTAATTQRLTVQTSFQGFCSSLLHHAVQRPPLAVGVFMAHEVRAMLHWFLDSYYRHYKLFQYAFTNRVTLVAAAGHPWDVVEVPLVVPPLCDAANEDQHRTQLEMEHRQREAEATAAAAAAFAAADADRVRLLQSEYEATVPDELRELVTRAVERELAHLKVEMERDFQVRNAGLLSKVENMERA